MNNRKMYTPNIRITSEIVLGVLFLVCGCSVYLLFRSRSLYIYQWCALFGLSDMIDLFRCFVQDWRITDWIKYSLPDGLYCASYILIIDAIWHNDNSNIKYYIISLIPFVTIGSELLQYFGLVKGTFDVYDLICYLVPQTIYLLYIFISQKYNTLKN